MSDPVPPRDPLSSIEVLRNLPAAARFRLERAASISTPANRTIVFAQGDASDAIFAILSGEGSVRIGAHSRTDKALMVEVFQKGDIFGEVGVIDDGPRTAAAVVDGSIRLLSIPAPIFQAVLHDTPALGAALARTLSQRLRRTFSLLQDATFETVEVRLARQILYLAALNGKKTPQGVVLNHRLNQSDLADLLGTTNRSIITILNDWRARQIVVYDTVQARLTVSNESHLRALVKGA